jgi:hypothetical protein
MPQPHPKTPHVNQIRSRRAGSRMPSKVHKVIVTNRRALQQKYSSAVRRIDQGLTELIAADKRRGLHTILADVSDEAAMKRIRARPVEMPTDTKQNKTAIDRIYDAHQPDYLMILGSVDVIPHQDLINPLFDDEDPFGDPDRYAYGDLPYACDHSYSQHVEDFTAPTRVFGRLPDVTGGTDADYLARLLAVPARHESLPRLAYEHYFAISARVWQGSTARSLKSIFGSASALQRCPPKGPRWPAKLLGARSHFINCHGSPADPRYYGEAGDAFPVAHDAALVRGKITEGTIAAVECCYGAELYDPIATGARSMGICNVYLSSKAYGFFGSSTVSYGPAEINEQADLITQDFLKHILSGASAGRATLQSRQDFIRKVPILGPLELKTLAQFHLLGDPSIHPVIPPPPDQARARTRAIRGPGAEALERIAGLALRRATLRHNAMAIAEAAHHVVTTSRRPSPPNVQAAIESLMPEAAAVRATTFLVRGPDTRGRRARTRTRRSGSETRIHVAVSEIQPRRTPLRTWVGVVAHERDGRLTMRKFYSR